MRNNKGVVLILVLWVLLILSLIAWGLGRRSSLEVSLLETYRGKLRSYAAARGAMNTILDLMEKTPSAKDTLYTAGVNIDQTKTTEETFSHIDSGKDAYAAVEWPARNYNLGDTNPHWEYGLRDEGGLININAIGPTNYQILSALIQLYGLSQPDADKLALAIVNYTGVNTQVSGNNSFLNMNNSALKPKNRPYENILELLEVDGMTQQIFDKIKDDVTVYGNLQNGLWINTDTANNDVIEAVAFAASRLNPSINPAQIIAQACAIRDGADGLSFTQDDGTAAIASYNNPNWPGALREGVSNFYRARVVGIDADSGTRTVLEAVIEHAPGMPATVISWERD